jgi:hypothetical protein
MNLIDIRKEAHITQHPAIDRLTAKQVDRVKVNVMTHCFDALDFFNDKESQS